MSLFSRDDEKDESADDTFSGILSSFWKRKFQEETNESDDEE